VLQYQSVKGGTVRQKAVVIGAGVGGLASAALLARAGLEVTLLEKNESVGGRARLWKEGGFQFDMGPSWYLMPEVFDNFFALFGRDRERYYRLKSLSPYYRVFFAPQQKVDITSDRQQVLDLFESFEPGSARQLEKYLDRARYKYDVAMKEFLYKSYGSVFEFLNARMLIEGTRLNVFGRLDRSVRRFFKDRRARQILEYAMVFLGTSPQAAPALYSIMSHVDLNLGVHYPIGGLSAVAAGIGRLAEEQGVAILLNSDVRSIQVEDGRARTVKTDGETFEADVVVVNGDYAFAETNLLDPKHRTLPEAYWRRKVFAPSMFILYLGLNKRLRNMVHHNLYFSEDWSEHFDTIFKVPSWPQEPCFYVSCISKTDPAMAPEGHENVFVLIPVAPGLDDGESFRERYADQVIQHIEKIIGEELRSSIVVRRVYSHRDFISDYHSYKGTALGLAHTLNQTAFFRPPFRSKKVENLYYAGQYTHPGVGVPMVLIAAQVAAGLIAGGSP
jgi:phytoene desaturase